MQLSFVTIFWIQGRGHNNVLISDEAAAASSASWYKWECNDITKHYLLPGLIISSYRSIRLLIGPGSGRHHTVHINNKGSFNWYNSCSCSFIEDLIHIFSSHYITHVAEGLRRAARWLLCPRVWLLETSTCEAVSRAAWHPCYPRSCVMCHMGHCHSCDAGCGIMMCGLDTGQHLLSLVTCETRRRLSPGTLLTLLSSCKSRPGWLEQLCRALSASAERRVRRETTGERRVRGQAGTGGPSPDVTRALTPASGHTPLTSLGVRCNQASELSPAWPRRPRASVELSWPPPPGCPGTLIGDIRGQATSRHSHGRQMRGGGGDMGSAVTWCFSDIQCQLPGVYWAQCGRHTQGMTSKADSHNMLQKRHKDTEQIISIYTSELCLGKRFVIWDGCHEGRGRHKRWWECCCRLSAASSRPANGSCRFPGENTRMNFVDISITNIRKKYWHNVFPNQVQFFQY